MAEPGLVFTAEGTWAWVPDTWAYFLQFPESFYATKWNMEAHQEKQERKKLRAAARQKAIAAVPFEACCVGGIVLANCEKCRGSNAG